MIEMFRTVSARDGAVIAYRVTRGATPRQVLVLLHGLASNMTRWSEFVEETSLASSWDIIRIDLRGNGRSIYRDSITMESWCGDLAAVLDAEGYPRAIVAGHCLGANIAVFFAMRYPSRTEGLILIEPLFRQAFAGALKKIQSFTMLLPPAIAGIRLLNRLGIYRRYFPRLDLRRLDRETRTLMASQGSPKALERKYGSVCFDLRFLPITAYLEGLRELSRPLPPLSDVHVPFLLLFSTGKIFSDSEIAQGLCRVREGCTSIVLDSRHWIPTEKPVEMRMAIEDWCKAREQK